MEIYNLVDLILNNIYITILLPFWIFLIIMVGRFFSVYINNKLINYLTLIASGTSTLITTIALCTISPDKILESDYIFLKINDFIITAGLHIDKLSLIFATTLFLISFCIQLFSIKYMENEQKKYRFYAFLNLFNFAMAGLFFSPNLFQTYFFWEIAGVVSYLLIGFDYFSKEKSLASKKVFIINRIGDTALICAIIICSYFMYTYAPNKSLTSLSFIDLNTISTIIYAYTSTFAYWLICGLFIIATTVKSAQFPFYNWLQDAMEAKLPVSALLHSATLVSIGCYIAIRLLPLFTIDTIIPKTFIIIGIITAFLCSISACAQNNPKKALAYSTSAHFGLIFFAIGLLQIKTAIILFVSHAIIKSLLFITLPNKNNTWHIFPFILFLISGLSLSGILFSGLISKELLTTNLNTALSNTIAILSFLTAFYIIRIALKMYTKYGFEKTSQSFFMLTPQVLLILTNIIFYIYLLKTTSYKIEEPFWGALTGWGLAYILYIKDKYTKIPVLYPLAFEGFYLDKFQRVCCSNLYNKISKICNTIDSKFFSNYKPILFYSKTLVNISSFIENKIMNSSLKFITSNILKLSNYNLIKQNGDIQKYNQNAFIIITIIITILILLYTAIISIIGGN